MGNEGVQNKFYEREKKSTCTTIVLNCAKYILIKKNPRPSICNTCGTDTPLSSPLQQFLNWLLWRINAKRNYQPFSFSGSVSWSKISSFFFFSFLFFLIVSVAQVQNKTEAQENLRTAHSKLGSVEKIIWPYSRQS